MAEEKCCPVLEEKQVKI